MPDGTLATSPQHQGVHSPVTAGFLRDYAQALLAEPLHDGYEHPAAALIERFLAQEPRAHSVILDLVGNNAKPSTAADTIRLLSHLVPGGPSWRAEIVAGGLSSPSVVVRDAAIQAIEQWEEPLLLEMLGLHVDPEPWLEAYRARLVTCRSQTVQYATASTR